MKTRIISGIVITVIAALLLVGQIFVPIIMPFAAAVFAILTVYEMLFATGMNKNIIMVVAGMLPAAILPFIFTGFVSFPINAVFTVFILLQFALCLKYHSSLEIGGVIGSVAMPVLISYAFSAMAVLAGKYILFYMILILCWSAVADTGAYFTGVAFGKHKMTPNISPKKTWEGLAGGMVLSILATLLACLIYSAVTDYKVNIIACVAVTPVFVLVGVMGDLMASVIKRKCGIKDYGNLIPGHGGIMDRFDSILMMTPLFFELVKIIPFIK